MPVWAIGTRAAALGFHLRTDTANWRVHVTLLLVHANSIPAVALGGMQRGVRAAQQRVLGPHVAGWEKSHTERQSHRQRRALVGTCDPLIRVLKNALRDRYRTGEMRAGQNHQEFVPAEAGHYVDLTHRAADRIGDEAHDAVPCLTPPRVVVR